VDVGAYRPKTGLQEGGMRLCHRRLVATDACGQGMSRDSREDPGRIAVAQEQLEQLIEGYVRRRTASTTI
jgi:hypothetical protein